jgi:hypothetical protein
MTQVAIGDARETAANMMANLGPILARHYGNMMEGTLGTRENSTRDYVRLLKLSQGHEDFLEQMDALVEHTVDGRAVMTEMEYFNEATGEYSMGAAYYPDWHKLLEADRLSFHKAGSPIDLLIKSLLDNPRFDALVKDRPLYVEDLGSAIPDAHGTAFYSRARNKTFTDYVATHVSKHMDRPERTAKAPVIIAVVPGTERFFKVATHEAAHLLTMDMVETIPEFKAELSVLLEDARFGLNETAPKPDGKWATYGLTNEHELIAEAFSNPRFAEALRGLPPASPGTPSLWGRLLDLIGRFLNKNNPALPSLLDDLVARVHRMLDEQGIVYAASLSRVALRERLTGYAKEHAPDLGIARTRVLTKSMVTDRRLKPVPLRVTADPDGTRTLDVAGSLLDTPGEAERLIARENAFAKFRMGMTQADFAAIRNAPDKDAFLPALLQAAKTPEDAMDLLDKMDDTAVYEDWIDMDLLPIRMLASPQQPGNGTENPSGDPASDPAAQGQEGGNNAPQPPGRAPGPVGPGQAGFGMAQPTGQMPVM